MGKLGKMFLYGVDNSTFVPLYDDYPVSPLLYIEKEGWYCYLKKVQDNSPAQIANLMLDVLDVVLLWVKESHYSELWEVFHKVTKCKQRDHVEQDCLLNLILSVKGTKEEKFTIQAIRCLTCGKSASKQCDCLLSLLSCLVEYDYSFCHAITSVLLYMVGVKMQTLS